VTLKENGCIIFISSISPNKLIVSSKNCLESAGSVHARTGRLWLQQHLKAAGRTEEEFARILYEGHMTAVFEAS
jgi:tRNA ligase